MEEPALKLRTLVVAVIASALFCAPLNSQQEDARGLTPIISSAHDLVQYAARIRDLSHVPPRLPNFLPYLSNGDSLYLTSAKIDAPGYDLDLGFEQDCQGQHVCFYSSFKGSVARFDPPDERPVRAQLVNGIQGLFYPPSIGAYCSDSSIRWTEHSFYYSIEMKCETQEMMVKLANSAVRNKR
jgi:hypothetical protein